MPPEVTPMRKPALTIAERSALTLTIITGVVSLVALVSINVWVTLRPPAEWNPLGPFPVQDVTEVNEDFVHVVGTKCYDEDLTVRGSFGWQRVDPPGFAITLGEGVRERTAGCVTQEFDNDIPAGVFEANQPGAVWRIVGTETPVRDDGTEGVSLTWQTEDFVLIPIE